MRLTGTRSAAESSIVVDESGSRGWTLAAVAASLILVFAVDRVSGLAPVQHLYYVPIILASVRFGYLGSTTAAIAILLYHLANPRVVTFQYTEGDVLQIALFVGIGVMAARLANDRRRLHRLAITDDLTGLHNLRSFETRLRALLRSAVVCQLPLTLLVLDLDRLKSLNDVHGHLAGAEAVRTIGHLIAGRLQAGGVACRYGGDEFVIAIADCDEQQARAFADQLRADVSGCAPVLAGVPFPAGTLSISIGIATTANHARPEAELNRGDPAHDDAAGEALFRAADAALYAAKAGGRNRVAVAQSVYATEDTTPA